MRSYSLFGFLIGVMLVIVGIISVFLLSSRVTLTCIRASNLPDQCEIVSVGKLRTRTQQIRLAEITGVSIEDNTDWLRKRGRRTNYRVVLLTKSGPVPLTEGFSSGMADKQRTSDQITAFLRSRTKPSLKIVESDNGIGLMIGAIFGASGIVLGKRSLRSSDD